MKAIHFLLTLSVLALAVSIASASDPSPLQDFCVAANDTDNACKYNFFIYLNCTSKIKNITSILYADHTKFFWSYWIFFFSFRLSSVRQWEILQGSKACQS